MRGLSALPRQMSYVCPPRPQRCNTAIVGTGPGRPDRGHTSAADCPPGVSGYGGNTREYPYGTLSPIPHYARWRTHTVSTRGYPRALSGGARGRPGQRRFNLHRHPLEDQRILRRPLHPVSAAMMKDTHGRQSVFASQDAVKPLGFPVRPLKPQVPHIGVRWRMLPSPTQPVVGRLPVLHGTVFFLRVCLCRFDVITHIPGGMSPPH